MNDNRVNANVATPGLTLSGRKVISATYTSTTNEGIRWSVTCEGADDLDAMGNEPGIYTFESSAGPASPPLAATNPTSTSFGGVGTTTYSGKSQVEYLLGASGQSMTPLNDATDTAVIQALGATAGVSILGDATGMLIEEYDLQGDVIGQAISKILKDIGYEFIIDVGGLRIFPILTAAGAGSSQGVGTVEKSRSFGERWTQVWCRKKSKATALKNIPISKSGPGTGDLGPVGFDPASLSVDIAPGGSGTCAYVAFYSGPNGGGHLCGWRAIDPTFGLTGGYTGGGVFSLLGGVIDPEGPAMSCLYSAEPPLSGTEVDFQLVIRGRPFSASSHNYDPSFTASYPPDTVTTDASTGIQTVTASGDTATRKKKLIVSSTFWPTLAGMGDIPKRILYSNNKQVSTVTEHYAFQPIFVPAGYLACGAICDSVSWSFGKNNVLSRKGWIPTS